MADNTTLNAGSGGDVIASDDVGGVKYQRVKLSLGADGTVGDAPVGAGTESGVLRVTLPTDGTGKIATVGAVTAITNALPAGTNAIGKLAANSGVDIGDVDVTSVTPGTAATSLGKAEDAAHTSGDVGVMSLAVRRDADTTLVGTDGDYAPLQVNASGSLKVAITAGAGSGGTSIADGASFTRDTTSLTPVGGVVEDSAPTLTAGDAVALSMTTGGAVRVAVASGGIAGAVVDSVAGATDEGVLAVLVRDDALATLTPSDGDYTQGRTNARGALWVALDSTVAQTVTLAAGTATNEVVGDVAQDAAVGGNPVLIGMRASTATPTAMSADGDSVFGWATRTGATVIDGSIVDDAAFTPATSRVVPIGLHADESSTDSVDEGDAGCPRMTLDRKAIVASQSHTAGGATPVSVVSAASTNATSLKGSAGQVYSVTVSSVNAAVRYLKFYNKATAPTVGTDTPVYVFPIPGNTAGAGITHNFPTGLEFTTGIAWALTVEATVAGTTGVSASEHVVSIGYK